VLRRILLASALLSCGKQQGTLEITTGPETDVFTKDPKPTQIVVEAFSTDGTSTRIGQAALPATTVELGEQKKSAIATIRVTARDAQNKVLVQGSSLLLELGVLGDRTLQIFVQRTGELARMPGTVGDAREDPMLTMLAGRYVLVVGGTDANLAPKTQLYDLMSLAKIENPPTMKFVPRSIAPVDIGIVLIADDRAEAKDFSKTADPTNVPTPEGGTFAEVAGGLTVEGDGGVQYVVGATRATGKPTDKILKIKPTGEASFLKLIQARLAAGACWVVGRGLVVAGGSAMAPGIEIVPPESGAVPTAFSADMTMGVAAPLSGSKIVFASGGRAQVFDLACAGTCVGMPFGGTGDPIVQVLGIGDDVLALRRAADGTTHAFKLGANVEVAFKISRKNARALKLPTGSIAVVGGSNVIESFAF
jgi:hypothetical protein